MPSILDQNSVALRLSAAPDGSSTFSVLLILNLKNIGGGGETAPELKNYEVAGMLLSLLSGTQEFGFELPLDGTIDLPQDAGMLAEPTEIKVKAQLVKCYRFVHKEEYTGKCNINLTDILILKALTIDGHPSVNWSIPKADYQDASNPKPPSNPKVWLQIQLTTTFLKSNLLLTFAAAGYPSPDRSLLQQFMVTAANQIEFALEESGLDWNTILPLVLDSFKGRLRLELIAINNKAAISVHLWAKSLTIDLGTTRTKLRLTGNAETDSPLISLQGEDGLSMILPAELPQAELYLHPFQASEFHDGYIFPHLTEPISLKADFAWPYLCRFKKNTLSEKVELKWEDSGELEFSAKALGSIFQGVAFEGAETKHKLLNFQGAALGALGAKGLAETFLAIKGQCVWPPNKLPVIPLSITVSLAGEIILDLAGEWPLSAEGGWRETFKMPESILLKVEEKDYKSNFVSLHIEKGAAFELSTDPSNPQLIYKPSGEARLFLSIPGKRKKADKAESFTFEMEEFAYARSGVDARAAILGQMVGTTKIETSKLTTVVTTKSQFFESPSDPSRVDQNPVIFSYQKKSDDSLELENLQLHLLAGKNYDPKPIGGTYQVKLMLLSSEQKPGQIDWDKGEGFIDLDFTGPQGGSSVWEELGGNVLTYVGPKETPSERTREIFRQALNKALEGYIGGKQNINLILVSYEQIEVSSQKQWKWIHTQRLLTFIPVIQDALLAAPHYAVALLAFPNKNEFFLSGYGRLSDNDFSPLNPISRGDYTVAWVRNAGLHTLDRLRGEWLDDHPLSYDMIVYGPGGELYPNLSD